MVNLITNTDIKILNCLNKSEKSLNKTNISFETKVSQKVSNPRVDYLVKMKLLKKQGDKFLLNKDNSNEGFIKELIKRFKHVLNDRD